MKSFHEISYAVFSNLAMNLILLATLLATPLFAGGDEEAVTTSVKGRVVLPKKVSEGIDVDGLSLDNAVIMLEGNYKHPRRPTPKNWSDMAIEERKQWSIEFKNSEDYQEYERKAEQAKAARAVFTTEIAEDGTFTFENIKPAWYQLRVMIMHPDAKGEPSFNLARGYALHQFIIKNAKTPHQLGTRTLKLKNVLMGGDTAPDWMATGYDGKEFKLSDFRGRFVVIDFWATWCGPCVAEIPNLEAVYKDFGGERFEMIGLSIDESIDLPKAFHKNNPSTYRLGFVGRKEWHRQISESYGIEAVPAIWLIGPDGRIVARDLHGKALREEVRTALEPAFFRSLPVKRETPLIEVQKPIDSPE